MDMTRSGSQWWSQIWLRSGPISLSESHGLVFERTVHRGMVGTSVGSESFSDLDFADGVAVLAEMLSLLVLPRPLCSRCTHQTDVRQKHRLMPRLLGAGA